MAVQPVSSPIHLTYYLVPSKTEDRVWVVEATIQAQEGTVAYNCRCKGWQFNQKCHHVTAARKAFRSGLAGGTPESPMLIGVGEGS